MRLRAKQIDASGIHDFPPGTILDLGAPKPDSLLWIDVEAPDVETLTELSEQYDIHELVHADVLSEGGRARVERIDDHLVMVFKALNFNPGEALLDVVSVYFVVTEECVLTFHAAPVLSINEVWEELQHRPNLPGAIGLIHALLDRLMGRYLEVSDELEEHLEKLEPDIVGELDPTLPGKIFNWKRHLLGLRKRIRPHRDALMALLASKHPLVTDDTRPYFRDVLDQVLRTEDRLANHRDLLQGAVELYMAGAAQETNEVMKTLSLVATIVLPLNILTGVYGTNFEVLPGSKVEGAFWIFALTMALMAGGTGLYFRRRGWL